MNAITFTVLGEPVPQPRPRIAARGRFAHAYVPKDHQIHAFRESVRIAALAAGVQIAQGPVVVSALCVWERPASHRKSDGSLTSNAPLWPGMRCGDADNIIKGIKDALKGVAYHDDSQADLGPVQRRYGRSSFVRVSIVEFEPEDFD